MEYEWDENKRQQTLAGREVDFADAVRLDWEQATTRKDDDRANYGETRFVTVAPIDDRLHVLVW
jgi:uncharacterized DUF497 family protein